jgi:hypothetical protein
LRLSEAIRAGIAKYPKMTYGANVREPDKACVDGAARFGFVGNGWARDHEMPKEYWDGYNAYIRNYGSNIVHANDIAEKSRETIAEELEAIGY